MIMWRSRFILASLVAAALLAPAACGPNLDDLHLSSCMKDCNAVAKQCLDDSNAKLEQCKPDDNVCAMSSVKESEACLTSCLDCIDICVAETEKTLKK